MASKVWDDLSMWNIDFSQVYPSYDLSRVNALELAMLEALKYFIRVTAGEYAKYYFHLRSMMVRLGLHGSEPNYIKPLDLAGARRLQLSTENYEQNNGSPRRRHYSMHVDKASIPRNTSYSGYCNTSNSVGLEQIIHTDHMDADGQIHKKSQYRSPISRRAEAK